MLEERIDFSRENLGAATRITMSAVFRGVRHEVSFTLPEDLVKSNFYKGVFTADIGHYSGVHAFIESANNNSDLVFVNFIDYPMLDPSPPNMFTVHVAWTGNDSRFVGKFFKLLPHIFLDNFQSVLWIDSNMILSPIDDFFESVNSYDFVCLLHDKRMSIPSEAAELILHGKDDKQTIDKLLLSYDELVDDLEEIPLLAGRFLYRRCNERVREFNNLWFSLLVEGSIRDQLSLPIASNMVSVNSLLLPSKRAGDLFRVLFHKRYNVSKYGKGFLPFVRSSISRLKYKLAKLKYFIKDWLGS